jgi:hypothetical protein
MHAPPCSRRPRERDDDARRDRMAVVVDPGACGVGLREQDGEAEVIGDDEVSLRVPRGVLRSTWKVTP